MTKNELLDKICIDPKHFLTSIAFNAVAAAMGLSGRTLMTASDAQRVEQICSLLHLDGTDRESPEVGQVVAREQPKPHKSMAGIEDAIGRSTWTNSKPPRTKSLTS